MDMALTRNFNYKTRIFALIMIFTWLVAFVIFGVFYFREKEFKAEMIDSQLQIYNAQLLKQLAVSETEAMEYIKDVTASQPIRFTILDCNGVVIYDTQGVPKGSEHGNRQEIAEAMKVGQGYTLSRTSSSDNQNYFYSARKGGDYIVRSSRVYDDSLVNSLQEETVYLWTVLIMSLILTVIAFYASRRLGSNIDKLRDFALRAEKDEDFDETQFRFNNDELGEISTNIIRLYKSAKSALAERDSYYNNLLREEQEKARIKHQMTNNINHELKTPVHAIKGCLDTITLNYDKLDKSQILTFIEKSDEQIQRLCNLLNDISSITRLTDAPQLIEKEKINVTLVVEEIRDELMLLPEQKQMRINIELPAKITINGNRGFVESIFRNLVNNSIAYSGGRDIYIKLIDETDDEFKFSVADNGIGISEKHLDKVFERFYRIDEGRSRKVGGTGLGLSIVKNAVLFHGGNIKACQRQGGGVEFVFTLSKK